MKLEEPYLIISLSNNKVTFFVISYNEKNDYKIIKNITIDSDGIKNDKIINIDLITKLIKLKINLIEDELNHFFSKASIVINPDNVNCINISGYKKLNGSQVSKEDITYILNDIKETITSNESKHSLVHLFNSSFSIDSDNLENLPIGLFGELYNQNMTFFLVNKNILNNLKLVFNNCGINIDRILLKSFVEGINFLLNNKNYKNFTAITLNENIVNISLFKNRSYVYTQDFRFGTDLIIKDISKLCSLQISEVEFFLQEVNLKSVLENDESACVDKKFFFNSPYRKIKYKLVLDIIIARTDELIDICFVKNSNLDYFRKTNNMIYINVEKNKYFKNIKFALEKNILIDPEFVFDKKIEEFSLFSLNGAAVLIGKGWEKEAIPVVQLKKSIISSFFSRLFS